MGDRGYGHESRCEISQKIFGLEGDSISLHQSRKLLVGLENQVGDQAMVRMADISAGFPQRNSSGWFSRLEKILALIFTLRPISSEQDLEIVVSGFVSRLSQNIGDEQKAFRDCRCLLLCGSGDDPGGP